VWLVALIAASGCVPFIMRGEVVRQDAGWTITLEALKDGPNGVQTAGNTVAVPDDGLRFLWAWVKIRNDLNVPRAFGYDTCDVDLVGRAMVPTIIGKLFFTVEARSETYGPGETLDRRLIFAYPVGLLPTRIRCANMVWEVPGARPKGTSG
jgi:hypothetical protein